MNTIREIKQINELELERGIAGTPASWHAKYANSAWVYVGNLDKSLSEGDILCVLSQYGELDDMNLSRDEATGESRGFAFAKYRDARSAVLAVDNFCGIQLCGRSLRVDHVENYRLPKELMEKEELDENQLGESGLAYKDKELENEFSLQQGQNLFARSSARSDGASKDKSKEAKQKRKEERQRLREEKEQRRRDREAKRAERDDKRHAKRKHSKKSGDSEEQKKKKHRRRSDSSDDG